MPMFFLVSLPLCGKNTAKKMTHGNHTLLPVLFEEVRDRRDAQKVVRDLRCHADRRVATQRFDHSAKAYRTLSLRCGCLTVLGNLRCSVAKPLPPVAAR